MKTKTIVVWLNWRLLALIRGIFRNLLALSEEVLYTVTHFVWVTWLLTDCFMAMWGPLPRYRNKNYVDKRSGTTCLLELSIWDPKRCPYKWGRPLIIQLKKTKQKQRTFRSDQINKLVHFLLKIKGSIHWKSWKKPQKMTKVDDDRLKRLKDIVKDLNVAEWRSMKFIICKMNVALYLIRL